MKALHALLAVLLLASTALPSFAELVVDPATGLRTGTITVNGQTHTIGPNTPMGTDLSNADLSSADFRGAQLNGANFSGANLNNANLSHAELTEADFTGANLSGAILTRANTSDVRFVGANLAPPPSPGLQPLGNPA